LIDPARPLYSDENLVTNIEPLRKFLKSLPEREKDKADISIYFEVLTTGANVSVNADLKLWPASLAKLPLAMVVMKKIEEGSLQENSKIVFTKDEHRIQLVVSAPEKVVNVVVVADDVKVLSGKLELGEKKVILADREIRISSDNGKATYVEVGSESPRALSAEEQPVKEVVFTPQ
jgi:hypothetical protein